DIAAQIGDFDAALLFDPGATLSLHDALETPPVASATRLLVIIGAESGFTPGEIVTFTKKGAVAVTLGARILRTETAALVALAQILYARGE
ncbi:MAG: RNA methyltransferase, partial [Armatimonadetes bacterium]|nr:RNA methyltransferase [Armatimonadota bacterium]